MYSLDEALLYVPFGKTKAYREANAHADRIATYRARHGFLVPADVMAPRENEIPAVRDEGRLLVNGRLLRQKLCGGEVAS